MAAAVAARKLLLLRPPFSHPSLKTFSNRHSILSAATNFSTPTRSTATTSSASTSIRNCNSKRKKVKENIRIKEAAAAVVKRRTRSDKEFDEDAVLRYGDSATHIPVMLGEVLDVFASLQLRSFVDCTLGAAGHSSAVSTFSRFSFPTPFGFFFSSWVSLTTATHGGRWIMCTNNIQIYTFSQK